jgi:defect-in-organelle-trafficking protein DotB
MAIETFPDEPASAWTIKDFDRFLLWARSLDASDIAFAPGMRGRMRVYGKWCPVTQGKLETSTALMPILLGITGAADSWARVIGMEPLDPRYEVPDPEYKWKRHRFRVNATACVDRGETGVELVLRSIPTTPPTPEEYGLEPELLRALMPENGASIVTGKMGSGKSTLLATVSHEIIRSTDRHMLTYEAPAEFDLMGLNDRYEESGGFVIQAEIGRHLASFRDAPINSTRRAPDVVIYGEVRDAEQMRGLIEQGEIGTAVYGTLHTHAVSTTPGRLLNVFPEAERDAMRAALFSSLRVVIQQRLPRTVDGRRTAARESLIFDEGMRAELMRTHERDLQGVVEEMVQKKGQPLMRSMEALWRRGTILKSEYEAILAEKSSHQNVESSDVA